jgi:hypothetical protein
VVDETALLDGRTFPKKNLAPHNRDNIPIDKRVRESKTSHENETQLIAKENPDKNVRSPEHQKILKDISTKSSPQNASPA